MGSTGDDQFVHLNTWISPDPLNVSYTYVGCAEYAFNYNGCYTPIDVVREVPFTPPFIYSGECRNAFLTSFIPVVILSSASQAFVYPLFYFFLTNAQNSLKSQILLFGLFKCGALEEYVLTASYMRLLMSQIWSSMLMLLTYGILCPYAAVSIGIGTIAQIIFLKFNICRHFYLEKHGAGDEMVGHSTLETMCRDCHNTVHAMLWPGFILLSILFSLYVFDMSYDTENLSLEYPISVLCLTLMIIPISRVIFYYSKISLGQRRDRNVWHMNSLEIPQVLNPLSSVNKSSSSF